MANYTINISENFTYKSKLWTVTKLAAIMPLLIVVILVWQAPLISLSIAIVQFLWLYIPIARTNIFYITHIQRQGEKITISYRKKHKYFTIAGVTTDFRLQVQQRYIGKDMYMKVYFKNKLVIEQFAIDPWNTGKFDEVMTALKA